MCNQNFPFRFEDIFKRMIQPKPVEVVAAAPSNPILKCEEEMDRYLNLPLYTDDPLLFWRTRQHEFPKLAKLARKFLATPPSSVYSERSFSELGNIYSDQRASLSPMHSKMLLFLHHNLRRLDLTKWSLHFSQFSHEFHSFRIWLTSSYFASLRCLATNAIIISSWILLQLQFIEISWATHERRLMKKAWKGYSLIRPLHHDTGMDRRTVVFG